MLTAFMVVLMRDQGWDKKWAGYNKTVYKKNLQTGHVV